MARRFHTTLPAAITFALLPLAAAACAGEPPALQVGPLAYSSSEIRLLSPGQRTDLATLTAFGLLASNDQLARLAREAVQEKKLRVLAKRLAYEIAFEHAGIGEAELRRRYAATPDHELVVRHILFLSERWRPDDHRATALERASDALERVRSHPAEFAAIAAKLSEEPGAAGRAGKLAPARKGDWVPNFWRAAAALEEGEISGIVESRYGYHIIKLLERRSVPFDDVRGSVLGRLVRDGTIAVSAREYADSLRAIPPAEVTRRALVGGVGISSEKTSALLREELAAAEHAAAVLGFADGKDSKSIKRTARVVLGATAQNIMLLRKEVLARGPILRTLYPVVDSRSSVSSSDTRNTEESG